MGWTQIVKNNGDSIIFSQSFYYENMESLVFFSILFGPWSLLAGLYWHECKVRVSHMASIILAVTLSVCSFVHKARNVIDDILVLQLQ